MSVNYQNNWIDNCKNMKKLINLEKKRKRKLIADVVTKMSLISLLNERKILKQDANIFFVD